MKKRDAAQAARFRRAIHAHLLKSRGGKYRGWLFAVGTFQRIARFGEVLVPLGATFFASAGARVELMHTLYAVMRMADDYADGDAPLPAGWENPVDYIDHLISSAVSGGESDELSALLQYVFRLGDTLDIEIRPGVLDILRTLRFDAERRSAERIRVFDRAELRENFDRLDVRGCIGLCLRILREPMSAYPVLAQLGEAVRIHYTLRDFGADVRAGLCNIPREDMQALRIAPPQDADADAWMAQEPVQTWFAQEAERAIRCFGRYKERKQQLGLHPFTAAVLWVCYELPARHRLGMFRC